MVKDFGVAACSRCWRCSSFERRFWNQSGLDELFGGFIVLVVEGVVAVVEERISNFTSETVHRFACSQVMEDIADGVKFVLKRSFQQRPLHVIVGDSVQVLRGFSSCLQRMQAPVLNIFVVQVPPFMGDVGGGVSAAFGWVCFFFAHGPFALRCTLLCGVRASLLARAGIFSCLRTASVSECHILAFVGDLCFPTKETSGAPHAEIHLCGRSSPEPEILAARSVLSDWLVPHQASCWSVPRTQRYKWTWTRTKQTPRGIETTMQRYVETQTTRKKRKEKPKGITEKHRKELEKQKAATSAMSVTSAPAAILPVCAAPTTTSCQHAPPTHSFRQAY